MSHGGPRRLFKRRLDDWRAFEDEPFRRAASLVDERTFKERSGGRTDAPAVAGEPQAVVHVGQEAGNVGGVGDRDGRMKSAAAGIGFARLLVAQPVRGGRAHDARGGRERGTTAHRAAQTPRP